jgi:hypothetical protein
MTDEESLGRWFARVSQPQLAVYNFRMHLASAYRNTPKWERMRADAQKEFAESTNDARKLYEAAISDLQNFDEIGEALDAEMTQFEISRIMEDVA